MSFLLKLFKAKRIISHSISEDPLEILYSLTPASLVLYFDYQMYSFVGVNDKKCLTFSPARRRTLQRSIRLIF